MFLPTHTSFSSFTPRQHRSSLMPKPREQHQRESNDDDDSPYRTQPIPVVHSRPLPAAPVRRQRKGPTQQENAFLRNQIQYHVQSGISLHLPTDLYTLLRPYSGCLHGFDLSHLNLAEVTIENIDFTGANLSYVNLTRAQLRFCVLREVNLAHALLYETLLQEVEFDRVCVTGTDFRGTRWRDTIPVRTPLADAAYVRLPESLFKLPLELDHLQEK